MSMAIIVQKASNTGVGGSLDGFLSGTSAAAADTFYGRRLTEMLINESSGGVPTVNTFTASTGGSGAASTAGQFTLVPGTYRIQISAVFNLAAASGNIIFGLYNTTSTAFEVYTGTSTPILGNTVFNGANLVGNMPSMLIGGFTVTTSNKTYEIRQKGSSTTVARSLTACGQATSMTGTNVNSAAAENWYCFIKLLKTA